MSSRARERLRRSTNKKSARNGTTCEHAVVGAGDGLDLARAEPTLRVAVTDVVGVSAGLWTLLAVGALLVGFSKTAVGGAATVAVALFASVLPVRESTGVVLALLMTGDLVGVWTYRRDADWRLLGGLVVPVLLGVAAGVGFLLWAPQGWLRPLIGLIVVTMCVIELWRRLAARRVHGAGEAVVVDRSLAEPAAAPGQAGQAGRSGRGFGVLAGFTTMVANAGGPVMTLYLLRRGGGVRSFLGTIAWFFWAVNVVKLPFSIGLGFIPAARIPLVLTLVPVVLVGAVVGRVVIGHLSRTAFEWTVLVASTLSGLYLLFA